MPVREQAVVPYSTLATKLAPRVERLGTEMGYNDCQYLVY